MKILICRLLFVCLLTSAGLFLPEQETSTGHSIEFPGMYFTNIPMTQKQCWRKYFIRSHQNGLHRGLQNQPYFLFLILVPVLLSP